MRLGYAVYSHGEQNMSQPTQATRIVIVDDQVDLADMLSAFLTDEGYVVTICNDSRDALALIQRVQPAAVVLDVMMPDVDGFEILRQLRALPQGQRLPVVLISAAWRANERKREIGSTFEIAPTLVLPKPFELSELDRCLRQMGVRPVPGS